MEVDDPELDAGAATADLFWPPPPCRAWPPALRCTDGRHPCLEAAGAWPVPPVTLGVDARFGGAGVWMCAAAALGRTAQQARDAAAQSAVRALDAPDPQRWPRMTAFMRNHPIPDTDKQMHALRDAVLVLPPAVATVPGPAAGDAAGPAEGAAELATASDGAAAAARGAPATATPTAPHRPPPPAAAMDQGRAGRVAMDRGGYPWHAGVRRPCPDPDRLPPARRPCPDPDPDRLRARAALENQGLRFRGAECKWVMEFGIWVLRPVDSGLGRRPVNRCPP